jgi:hypothetical protein
VTLEFDWLGSSAGNAAMGDEMPRHVINLGEVAARGMAVIELRCRRCALLRRLSVARLLAEHGPAAAMGDVIRAQVGDCPRRDARLLQNRCNPYSPDLAPLYRRPEASQSRALTRLHDHLAPQPISRLVAVVGLGHDCGTARQQANALRQDRRFTDAIARGHDDAHGSLARGRDGDPRWPNIAEEIENIGWSGLHSVESLLTLALLHDLKAQAWPLSLAADGWRADARLCRRQARRRFTAAMRQKIDLTSLYADALAGLPEKIDGQPPSPVPAACPVTLEELLPPEPGTPEPMAAAPQLKEKRRGGPRVVPETR